MAESGYLRDFITGADGLGKTAFGEIAANPLKVGIAWNFQYNLNTDIITSTHANGGTVTQAAAQAVLQTSTNTTGMAEISTKDALRYSPGVGGIARFTSVFNTPAASSKQIIGLGDVNDGFFVGYNSTSFGFMRRQNGTETWSYTSEWTETPISGFDPTKGNVYQVKFQWLGYGEIKYYIEDVNTGGFVLQHRIEYANQNTVPSIYSPCLPLHAKISNTGNGTNLTMKTPSGMAGIEGEIKEGVLTVANGYSNTVIGVTSEYPIVTIKNSTSFIGIANRQRIKINEVAIACDGNKNSKFNVYKNATLSTSASIVDLSSTVSPAQRDIGSTSATAGRLILSYALGKAESKVIDISDYNINLAPGDTITITAQSTAATDATAAVNMVTFF